MATQIQELLLEDGEKIFVAVEVLEDIDASLNLKEIKDLPPGAEPTGIIDDSLITAYLLKAYIKGMAKSTKEALKDMSPDEFSIELSIGFVGKANPIPVIAGADIQGGIKVTATWKKEDSNQQMSSKHPNDKKGNNKK